MDEDVDAGRERRVARGSGRGSAAGRGRCSRMTCPARRRARPAASSRSCRDSAARGRQRPVEPHTRSGRRGRSRSCGRGRRASRRLAGARSAGSRAGASACASTRACSGGGRRPGRRGCRRRRARRVAARASGRRRPAASRDPDRAVADVVGRRGEPELCAGEVRRDGARWSKSGRSSRGPACGVPVSRVFSLGSGTPGSRRSSVSRPVWLQRGATCSAGPPRRRNGRPPRAATPQMSKLPPGAGSPRRRSSSRSATRPASRRPAGRG